MIDINLISKFRDKVNENDFVLFKYKNVEDKNQWNCICSAMDWITVAVEYISKYKIKTQTSSIEVYSYISSIDIVWEAIIQLNRVIFQTTKVPFSKDKTCFSNNIFNQTDNIYFKTIRACFGAHPVNLSDPTNPKNEKKKRYACWSGNHFGDGDFSVYLYSNQTNEENILLSIYFNQINDFFEKRYNYLNNIIKEIDLQFKQFCNLQSQIPIEKNDDTLEQLYILQIESKNRLNNNYYNYLIGRLILLFSTSVSHPKNEPMVNEYREKLKALVEKVYYNLQNMKIEDLDDNLLNLSPKLISNGWGYWMEKLCQYLEGVGYSPTLWENNILEFFSGNFEFCYNSYEELYLLIQSSIYQKVLKENIACE